MRKFIMPFAILICSGKLCQAQTFAEWFEQKKTEIKYYLNQIAALAAVKSDIEGGIKIAQEGLDFISAMKKGELDLHTAFYNSLKAINPEIAKYERIADIISYQEAIIHNWNKSLAHIRQSKMFSPSEMTYLINIYGNMSTECSKMIADLINLITPDVFQMKDDERVKRIDEIYFDMKNKYAFTQSFNSESSFLVSERLSEENDVKTAREYHGIN